MKELNIKSLKALEDISKHRELFRKRSNAYTLEIGSCFNRIDGKIPVTTADMVDCTYE
jgi:hypothetical protein